jgi:hypothetical protein
MACQFTSLHGVPRCPTPLSRPLPSPYGRSSVAVLDLQVKVILMRIAQHAATVELRREANCPEQGTGAHDGNETSPLLGDRISVKQWHRPHISVEPARQPLLGPRHERRRSRFYNSFPNSPTQSRVQPLRLSRWACQNSLPRLTCGGTND